MRRGWAGEGGWRGWPHGAGGRGAEPSGAKVAIRRLPEGRSPREAGAEATSRRAGWRRGVPGQAEREAGEAALAWHTAPGAGGWHDAVSLELAEANPRHRQHDRRHRAGGGGRPAAPHYAADHERLPEGQATSSKRATIEGPNARRIMPSSGTRAVGWTLRRLVARCHDRR